MVGKKERAGGHRRASSASSPTSSASTDAVTLPDAAPPTGKRVAVVGSGPAGLTVAADLVLLGHERDRASRRCTSRAACSLYGIPEFRLPKDDRRRPRSTTCVSLGVEFEINAGGRQDDRPSTSCLARRGTTPSSSARAPGCRLHGHPGREPARRLLGQRVPDPRQPDEGLPLPGLRHADRRGARAWPWSAAATWPWTAARTALRLGAERSPRLPPHARRDAGAHRGDRTTPRRRASSFQLPHEPGALRRQRPGLGAAARVPARWSWASRTPRAGRRPVPMAGSTYQLDVDLVMVAIGAGPTRPVPTDRGGLERSERGNIRDRQRRRPHQPAGVCAGGDIVTGAATVILAMGAGPSGGGRHPPLPERGCGGLAGGRPRRVAVPPPAVWPAMHTGVASRAGAPGRRRRGAPAVPSTQSRTE